MKKIKKTGVFTVILIVAMTLLFTSCGSKDQKTKDKEKEQNPTKKVEEEEQDSTKDLPIKPADPSSMKGLLSKIDSSFDEFDVVTTAMPIDDQVLKDIFHIDPNQTVEYAGEMSFSMDNPDVVLCVKAKDGEGKSVQAALTQRLSDLTKQFEGSGNTVQAARVKSGEVYTKGNDVFLIIVGINEDGKEQGSFDFSKDVAKIKKIIDDFLVK